MCKCTPIIRTPFCGRGDCLPPASRAQDMEREFEANAERNFAAQEAAMQEALSELWKQAVRQAEEENQT